MLNFRPGQRRISFSTELGPADLCAAITPLVTPPAPHGMFRDWPNEKPYMGSVDDFGFSLREKTRFGKGWPLRLEGRFEKSGTTTHVSVNAGPTPVEAMIASGMYIMAGIFITVGIFFSGAEPIASRVLIFAVPILMIILFELDQNKKTGTAESELKKILGVSEIGFRTTRR